MADRLTQLQVCVDQLVAQMDATVNYVNNSSGAGQLDADPRSVTNLAAQSEPPQADFDNTLNELATDIVLKSRQITMLIDSLPGIGVSEKSQLELIQTISQELQQVEQERIDKIKEKDQLLQMCESLILEVADGISQTKSSV